MSTSSFFTFGINLPFSFWFSLPGLRNPFVARSTPPSAALPAPDNAQAGAVSQVQFDTELSNTAAASAHKPRRPSHPHFHLQDPLPSPSSRSSFSSRKRPLDDSGNDRLQAATMLSTRFTPVSSQHDDRSNPVKPVSEPTADIPPAKKRKGITDTVISTAFNAALFGAAIGLSVYRLWHGRSEGSETVPPPPYEEEWIHAQPMELTEFGVENYKPSIQPGSPLKARLSNASKHRISSLRHRQKPVRSRLQRTSKHSSTDRPSDDFEMETLDAQDEILDEMDWIGDRLTQLIEEGKRALKREIVISSESPEDEVDDGSGNWADEDTNMSTSTPRFRRSKFDSNSVSSCYSDICTSSRTSPRSSKIMGHNRFNSASTMSSTSSMPMTPIQLSPQLSFSASHETRDECTSPAIQESMELARLSYRRKRCVRS